nr:MAG TPA: PORTAL PROTEIN [Caudoviricetes sp.]
MLLTYQDFEKYKNQGDTSNFIRIAIENHRADPMFVEAVIADEYDRQRNITINEYIRTMFTLTGTPIEDFTASNNRIASNFFHRLNTQRCTYSLGNGISFQQETVKDKLGGSFDTKLWDLGYKALIHGVSFGFWNVDKLHVFPLTEFVPLWDEYDGTLKAGIRYWRLAPQKPTMAVLYEIDGYTKYRSEADSDTLTFTVEQDKKPYKTRIANTEMGEPEVIGVENYSSLPIVPMWGSKLHQSTLVGMREKIDSFDLIRSGFANDLTDCSQIYWIISNCGGMEEEDLARFRDRLKINHIANADEGDVTPYTQEIPYQARKQYLDDIRAGIYEDFGGLDVHTIAAGATNDHIDAAYQPLDENADDFEYNVIEFVQQVLSLMNIDAVPIFKRNRISNQKEQTEMVLQAAQYLDEETVISKLPFITPDEIKTILRRKDTEDIDRLTHGTPTESPEETQEQTPVLVDEESEEA